MQRLSAKTWFRNRNVWFLMLFFICVISCKSENEAKAPDVNNIVTEFNVVDASDLLFRSENEIKDFRSKYPEFSSIYFENVLGIKDSSQLQLQKSIAEITNDKVLKGLQDTIKLEFGNLLAVKEELNQSFKYWKYYFPKATIPSVYFCNTLFNYQKFLFEDGEKDGIGIGLDLFLNKWFDYKSIDPSNPSYSQYLTRTFNKDHIVKKVFDLQLDEVASNPNGVRMIDQMIHNGKKLYVLRKIMPQSQDSILFEYSQKQLEWCIDNELEIWSFFIDKGLFYETAPMKIIKYVSDSPNSPGMPEEAPGRTANFIGFQIVKKYMAKHPNMSLQTLIDLPDAQKILDEAKYKPRRK